MLPNEALETCLTVHAGQLRKGPGNVPYAIHPIRVAILLSQFDLEPHYLEAALLHDTLEDQPERISVMSIRERFGHRVALLVEELTKAKGTTRREYIASFKAKSPEACLVKLADRADNLLDNFAWDPDYEPAYAEESERLLTALEANPTVKEFLSKEPKDPNDHAQRRVRDSYRRAFYHIEDRLLRPAIAKARSI